MSQAIVNYLGKIAGKAASATVTRPNDTTAYAAGDVISTAAGEVMTFTNVLANAGGAFMIIDAKIRIDVANIPTGITNGSAIYRLHLYNAAPTAIADNTAYNLPAADRAKYIDYIEFNTITDLGDTLFVNMDATRIVKGKLADGSTTLYGILQTVVGYPPSANAVKTNTLLTAGV